MNNPLKILCAILTLAVFPIYVQSQDTFNWTSIDPGDSLNWTDCFSPPLQCTRLNVPMNYSASNAGSFALALIRVPSSLNGTAAYQGPVLFNPGGLGGSGVDAMLQLGTQLATVIGPEFDIVSFDPRAQLQVMQTRHP
ncbi:hypothetical protein BDN70DRAFT_998638 [Pholiota conissans]|uniref:AB hydrolase-1 domain-containing protein n=1 Tax=Pholiota conissans TaxID=109636 RepID=A0A9P6CLP1_9AGAR|nr:hypothetical protein BDN70DRAFT_998638 [Pholiota conissans]